MEAESEVEATPSVKATPLRPKRGHVEGLAEESVKAPVPRRTGRIGSHSKSTTTWATKAAAGTTTTTMKTMRATWATWTTSRKRTSSTRPTSANRPRGSSSLIGTHGPSSISRRAIRIEVGNTEMISGRTQARGRAILDAWPTSRRTFRQQMIVWRTSTWISTAPRTSCS